ncbi:uncharacterized protein LOC105275741 isoform X2 [Ooceraea biroi]|uniref:uncharacterized protein LOC105275741 isoform X2 n=1 Tax=Ooceraea biroi TaxID=2015173 RepID=UPI0005B7C988|nr:uncharacterized protein LOC105275741 isoform X2 [Ooceraea biroi]
MSGVGSPPEGPVNGESDIGAAAAATGAVGGVKDGTREGSGDGGGGGGERGREGGEGNVPGVGFCDGGDGNGGRGVVATVVTDGVIDNISDDARDVTLSDARGTAPVSFCREATASRTCGGGGRCRDTYVANVLFPVTTRAPNGNGNGDDAIAAVTTNRRGFAPSSVESTTTTTTPPDAGSTDARAVGRSIGSSSGGSTATAAVVIVDDVPLLFRDKNDDGENGENHRRPPYRGNMVAAMNEHPSSTTTTTTTTSSLLAVNAVRNTVPISSSPAIMTTTTTLASGNNNNTNNNNPTSTMTMSNATIGSGANNNSSNNCNNVRNQEFQEMDGEDGGTTATTTTTAAAGILNFPCDFDHMYASMTDGGAPAAAAAAAATATATAVLGASPLRGNEPRQNDFAEVKHLKELLLLHLDLIQQQSEQIVTKDKLLAALRQENETLKLRLERMERRVNLQKLKSECNENSTATEHLGTCSPTSLNSVNVPSTSELHRSVQCESGNTLHESFKIRLNTSGGITTVKQEPHDQSKHEIKQEINSETTRFEWEEKKKRRSDPTSVSAGSKKKRGLSCSSTVSVDAGIDARQDKVLSQTLHEAGKKGDRKVKSLTKKESFLTTEEHYYTAIGDPNYTLSLKQSSPVETNSSLEVPNWRVKIYTSCYTMEGTENLDDEIFNKRHLKLENDERRRKRWDVQRIREQRHIEKLKQRQERQNHQATCYNTNHTGPCPSSMEEETITSLWPDIEQIQSLQVDPHLPVTAFGAAIPNFTPSEFSLPWSNTMRIKCRRPKRSTGRRKSTGSGE